MKVRITKWGNSLAVRIPKVFITHLQLAPEREVDMNIEEERLVLTKPKENLRELAERITPENRHDPTDWGAPVGKEAW